MCCSGPMPLPGAVSSGLTCEWESGRRERVGVCGGKGHFSRSFLLDLSLPSSLWLFWLLGNIFSEGNIALPDFEPPPSKPRRTLEVPRVNKVRLGRGWEEGLAAPACGVLPAAASAYGRGGTGAPHPRWEETPRVPRGRAAAGRASGPAPSAFPPFPWEGEPQPATP